MAIVNSICIKQCNCSKITITDTSDWDTLTIPDDIVSSVYVLYDSEGEIIETKSYEEYEDSVDFESTTTFPDGEYGVIVTFIDSDDEEYVIEEYHYNTCNIKCKKEQVIKDMVFEEDCSSCKDDTLKLAIEAHVLYLALCTIAICKNTTEADKYLGWLEDKLINYKCKSC